MKIYLDQNPSPAIAVAARALGEDVTDWRSDGMAGASDVEQLDYAIAEGRCLVTLDHVDFIAPSAARRAAGAPHFGVLVIYAGILRADSGRVAESLRRYAAEHPDGAPKCGVGMLPVVERES